jgi:hypothetical protein
MRIPVALVSSLVLAFIAQTPVEAADFDVSIRFSSKEVSLINEFFRNYHVDKKGGKKGAKPLPPGIAKNLARGKPLPPGIAKRTLPRELIVQLPPVEDGSYSCRQSKTDLNVSSSQEKYCSWKSRRRSSTTFSLT